MIATRRNRKLIAAVAALLPVLLAAGTLVAEVKLVRPAGLAASRQEWIDKSLAFLKQHPRIPHVEGGADVAGMDCSGAIVRLLGLVDIEAPRTAHGQYEWLRKAGRLTVVPATARSADDAVYRKLQPGDLVFWAKDPSGSADGFRVSHVHLYLGEEADGHRVMIGSSDGRSYRGKKLSGFGIVDYRVPKPGSATRIAAFGSPLPASAGPAPFPVKP